MAESITGQQQVRPSFLRRMAEGLFRRSDASSDARALVPYDSDDQWSLADDMQYAIERLLMDTELREHVPELAGDDRGYALLGARELGSEPSKDNLDRVIERARTMGIRQPTLNRAIKLSVFYTFGQGVSISAKDDAVNEYVQRVLDDPKNKAALFSHIAYEQREFDLCVDGNIFFVLFANKETGHIRVRTLPVTEIIDIITDPEDRLTPWYYRRKWYERVDPLSATGETRAHEAFYPDIGFRPKSGHPPRLGESGIDVIDLPVYHVKVGGLGSWRWGFPEVYAALDWVIGHRDYLSDFAAIMRSLRRFAWEAKTKGGANAVTKLRQKLEGRISAASGNPPGATALEGSTGTPPGVGSTFISGGTSEMKPVTHTGATVAAADNRFLLHQVAAATGWAEHFFGNAETSNFATAKTLDRPAELRVHSRQMLWADVFRTLLRYGVEQAALAGKIEGLSAKEITDFDDNLVMELSFADEERVTDIEATFPPILEHDIEASIKMLVSAATLDGKPLAELIDDETILRLFLSALSVQDIDAKIEEWKQRKEDLEAEQLAKEEEEQARKEEQLAAMRQQQQGAQPQPPNQNGNPPATPAGASGASVHPNGEVQPSESAALLAAIGKLTDSVVELRNGNV